MVLFMRAFREKTQSGFNTIRRGQMFASLNNQTP
jgi:hypothetical protein